MSEKCIQKLTKDVADQISSQQIIPTIHQCIKQLIDNSIDANATFIKVCLKQYGKQFFSVEDNGQGIKDVQKLGEGGNTSKLKQSQSSNQEYLQGIRTLGFRGQAINSIANLCKQMIIHTSFKQVSKEGKQKFQQRKYSVLKQKLLQKKQSIFTETFTKIQIQSLFHTLPVRKYQLDNKPKENLKKIYQLIFQVSLVYPEITFILANQVQGKLEIIYQIQKNTSNGNFQQNNNIDYFHRDIQKSAWKQRVQICFPKKLDDSLIFVKSKSVQGFILNTIDSGSSKKNIKFSKNLQYTYINRRPVNPLRQICKVFDNFYKKYNPYTKYVFFLNIRVQPSEIDVNLSPNKRDIFIKKQFLEGILTQIKNLIKKQVIQKITDLGQFKQIKEKKFLSKSQKKAKQLENNNESEKDQQDNSWRKQKKQKQDNVKIREQAFRSNVSQQMQEKQLKGNYLANYKSISNQTNNSVIDELNKRINKVNVGAIKNNLKQKIQTNQKIQQIFIEQDKIKNKQKVQGNSQSQFQEQQQFQDKNIKIGNKFQNTRQKNEVIGSKLLIQSDKQLRNSIFSKLTKVIKPSQNVIDSTQNVAKIYIKKAIPQDKKSLHDQQSRSDQQEQVKQQRNYDCKKHHNQVQCLQQQYIPHDHQLNSASERNLKINQKMQIQQNYARLQIDSKMKQNYSLIKDESTNLNKQSQLKEHACDKIKQFQISLKNQNLHKLNYVVEQRKGEITKSQFRNFHIHGQFNKGFILCTLADKKYIYIVDQHASQQKRLFQSFMDSKPQFYYVSKQVQITPIQVDQIEMARPELNASGFTFTIQNRSTLKLIKCPSHFKRNFGLEQFMQIAQTNKHIKQIPSFYNSAASKACRSAVMIGDQLDKRKMIDIVHRMSDLVSPWHCPHGRPSLISLGSFKLMINKIKPLKRVYKF